MYHCRKDPEKVSRAYLYSSMAGLEGADFLYFTAKDVDFEKERIYGQYFHDGKWERTDSPFPDVIINVVNPLTPNQAQIYFRLRKMIPFTSFSVGSKLSQYRHITKAGTFSDYLIPFKVVESPIDVLQFLKSYPKAIMKPVAGHHGNNIFLLNATEERITVQKGRKIRKYNNIRFLEELQEIIGEGEMFIQMFVTTATKAGMPYDFRLHVQKDGEGKWTNGAIYPKVGTGGKIVTNLAQGGLITNLDRFLNHEFEDEAINIRHYLEVFALQFAEHFDTLYPHKFDELGIDVGLDENMKLWIYEVNWRPGHVFIEAKTAKNAVRYAIYLAKQNKEKKTN
jgi:glutathione synthase/RimK-type ligase-like ATP-grasp enzyme